MRLHDNWLKVITAMLFIWPTLTKTTELVTSKQTLNCLTPLVFFSGVNFAILIILVFLFRAMLFMAVKKIL